jgi:predicted DNA-binding transcriptional regulator YafY
LPTIRQALRGRQKLALTLDGTGRTVRPLKLDYWGRLWTCVVWCETSGAFAEIRVDQITDLRLLPGLFVDEVGKRLRDYAP